MTTTTDCERAFVGALLQLPADRVLHALNIAEPKDLADPRLQVVAHIALSIAESGTAPDPAIVLATARTDGEVTRVEAVRQFALLLADLYAECPAPASVRFYAVAVLDEAIRRRCAELATRVGQAAEGESLDSLLALLDRELGAVRDLATRRDWVTENQPKLQVVRDA